MKKRNVFNVYNEVPENHWPVNTTVVAFIHRSRTNLENLMPCYSIYLTIYISIYLYIYLPIDPSISQSIYLSLNLPINESIYLPTDPSIYQPTSQSFYLPIYLLINQSINQ